MQIGCCCSIEDAGIAAEAGFDYLECRLTTLSADDLFVAAEPILARYAQSPLPVAAFNVFLPGTLAIVGPGVDPVAARQYTEVALARANRVGAKMLVLGSGRSRQVPDGYSRTKAEDQLVDFLRMAAGVAAIHGMTIAIEPLNRRESNIINSVAEAAQLAARVDRPQVRALADFYHMDEEDEALEEIVTHAEWLAHVHVADTGRGAPGTGSYPYVRFSELLNQAGYTGMVSVECRWSDFAAEAGPAARFLREQLG